MVNKTGINRNGYKFNIVRVLFAPSNYEYCNGIVNKNNLEMTKSCAIYCEMKS